MSYKKIIITLVLSIFLLTIATVSASDVNDTIVASEDTNQMELSYNGISNDNLQTNAKNTTQTDNKLASAENDLKILGESEGTYSDLRRDIEQGGILTKDIYRYVSGDGSSIEITSPMIVDGGGAVIDMVGSGIQAFKVSTSGVTFKNLTIKNAAYFFYI